MPDVVERLRRALVTYALKRAVHIIEGVGGGIFQVRDPFLASFGILEMYVSVACAGSTRLGRCRSGQIAAEHREFALRLVGARR